MEKYCIGVDFGTQSGRALLVRLRDGEEEAVSVLEYEHGVMTERLPSGTKLPPNFALQHPQDYLRVLEHTISDVVQKAKIQPEQVVGLGIAVTSSTILPVLEDGTPLCFLPEYATDPHSWIKLWKHHGAQQEAVELDGFLQASAPELSTQFGASSAERFLPKVVETKRQSPDVYEAAFTYLEVADWLVWSLTGKLQRSAPIAGYKSMWRKETGYLNPELLEAIDPDYAEIIRDKLSGEVIPLGRAGLLSPKMAKNLGLDVNTVVTTGYIDAHSSVLGAGVSEPGRLVMVMGTSTCHLLLDQRMELVEGMSGAIEDGIVEGLYAYESGQSSVGDQFQWYVENCLPKSYVEESAVRNLSHFEYLEQLARRVPMGGSGLLALDWWNGNRSVLNDATLSGVLVGLTTLTKPEEVYLALLESTAFGARQIMESFQDKGLAVNSICVCGGLPRKNRLLMQVYANVTNRTIEVASSQFTSALGMAIVAAAAVGSKRGGYDSLQEATRRMTNGSCQSYHPDPEIAQTYDVLYAEYKKLHDYFGRGATKVMQCLRTIRAKRGDSNLTS